MSKLQTLRKNKGLSQNELSILSNVNKRLIVAFENKERNIDGSGLDKLIPLAITLNCKISDLIENEELIEQCKKLGI